MAVKYRLIEEDIPRIAKVTLYDSVLTDFLGSRAASVRVDIPKRKPATVYQGLLKAKQKNPKFLAVGVVRRGDAIYLKK